MLLPLLHPALFATLQWLAVFAWDNQHWATEGGEHYVLAVETRIGEPQYVCAYLDSVTMGDPALENFHVESTVKPQVRVEEGVWVIEFKRPAAR